MCADNSSLDNLYLEYKEFGVDIPHIMENLIEHYSIELEKAVIVENMDNCIDEQKYTEIDFKIENNVLSIYMYGTGIIPEVFNNTIHRIAGTTKTDRIGLGHYGWGMKVGLGISEKMVIKTRIGEFQGAQEWILDEKGMPRWKQLEKPNFDKDMTIIEHHLKAEYSKKVDQKKVESTLLEYYPTVVNGAPVLRRKLKVCVNGRQLSWSEPEHDKSKPFKAEIDGNSATGYFYYKKDSFGFPEDVDKVAIIVCGRVIFRDTFGISTNKKISGYIHADFLSREITGDKTTIRRNSSVWKKLSTEAGKQLAAFLREMGELKEEEKWDPDFIKQLHKQINNTIRHFPELFKDYRATTTNQKVLIADESGQTPSSMLQGSQLTSGTKTGPGSGGGVNVEGDNPRATSPQPDDQGKTASEKKERKIRQGIQIKNISSDERKEAWFDYAESIVLINQKFPTYQRAENDGKKVLEYHCVRCVFDSLLEHVIKNSEKNNIDEFFNYRTEILSKWCEQ